MSEILYKMIVSYDLDMGIGCNGSIPFDVHSFSSALHGGFVIMGRKTFQSDVARKWIDDERCVVIVVSSNRQWCESVDARTAHSLDAALQVALDATSARSPEIFVVGGKRLFDEAANDPRCRQIVATRFLTSYACDTFIEPFDLQQWSFDKAKFSECGTACTMVANRVDDETQVHEEYQYLELIEEILKKGVKRGDRTGVGTLSVFGRQQRWDLSKHFPLLTTKRVFWRGVVEELLWFVSGSTDSSELEAKGINIWHDNTTREFLDKRGLQDLPERCIGAGYGFQWRHFGADYVDCSTDYANKGVDQLADVIAKLKENPTDRRILMSAWNPAALHRMALPPCHMFAQFYVADGKLSCQMYQRSCDMGLGVPFNIASYALLTRMIAHVTGLQAGEFIHTMGDAHVYLSHVKPLCEQLKRVPRQFPTLQIVDRPDLKTIDDFQFSDFVLYGYRPHKSIPMQMAV